jgi:hypothetical protein
VSGDKPRRIAPIVLAGAFGMVVALLFVVLRPSDTPFERAQNTAGSPSRGAGGPVAGAGTRSAPVRQQSATSNPPLTARVDSVSQLTPSAVGPATRADAGLQTPSVPPIEEPAIRDAKDGHEGDPESEGKPERPAQWCFLKTSDDHDYLSDSRAVWNGSRSVWMGKENDAAAEGGYFSSDILWQGVDATAFRGLRIEVSTQIKGRGYLQFFVRTATATDSAIVLHDQQLPSVPTTNGHVNLFPPFGVEWARFSIVADVPVETDVVYYGIALMGGRAIWIDDVRIVTVDPETPLTNERSIGGRFILPVNARTAFVAPANLDFEVTTREAAGC